MFPLKCVIVDDSLFIRETVSVEIASAGHKVISKYENGVDLLKEIDETDIDVIFLDIILPQITGLELIDLIKRRNPKIKIIMLSGLAEAHTISAALRLGAIDFIQKPVTKSRLKSVLKKLSDEFSVPSIEEVSLLGGACFLISEFLDEIQAHTTSLMQKVLKVQIENILTDLSTKSKGQFVVNLVNNTIELNPEIWGNFTEEDSFNKLSKVIKDLSFELTFLYSDEVIENLIQQAVVTMISKSQIHQLFEHVNPSIIGLPSLPILKDITETLISKASTTYEDLAGQLSFAVMNISDMGPEVVIKLNEHLLTETEYMRNSIFFYSLIGKDETFQEGLFGPLPVTSTVPLSSLIYATKIADKLILLCIYYTASAEKIVGDYNKINFLIKTRLSTINSVADLTKSVLSRIMDDIIQYLMES